VIKKVKFSVFSRALKQIKYTQKLLFSSTW